MNFENEYLKEQIITYLGNKRKLINFIDETVDDIIMNDSILSQKEFKDITFMDIFAGSGIVGRYSKLKGFKTYSNDLELYSKVIQDVLLCVNKNEVHGVFKNSVLKLKLNKTPFYVPNDNYQTILNFLNSLITPQLESNLYWSKHYAPKDTLNPDFNNERLFYTQENGQKLDAIVEQIENKNNFTELEKKVIQASMMYKMTKHINTSGTMKGFHNGWGGVGGAAKERILQDIVLNKLPLIDGEIGEVFNTYAENIFLENEDLIEFDFIYADPPYNGHQYSSNYNHLNTLALNDKWDPGEIGNGTRAGIRTDHTKSNFCKRTKKDEKTLAEDAFIQFINNVKCKYIILSYNNEGIVPIDELMNILSCNLNNTINVKFKIYNKYKGGKSTQTSNKVIEYIIIVEKNKTQILNDFITVKETLSLNTQKKLFLDKFINYKKIESNEINLSIQEIDNKIEVYFDNNIIFEIDKSTYKVIKENVLKIDENIVSMFLNLEIKTKEDLIELFFEDSNKEEIQKLIPKFNIKKHEALKASYIERLNNI